MADASLQHYRLKALGMTMQACLVFVFVIPISSAIVNRVTVSSAAKMVISMPPDSLIPFDRYDVRDCESSQTRLLVQLRSLQDQADRDREFEKKVTQDTLRPNSNTQHSSVCLVCKIRKGNTAHVTPQRRSFHEVCSSTSNPPVHTLLPSRSGGIAILRLYDVCTACITNAQPRKHSTPVTVVESPIVYPLRSRG